MSVGILDNDGGVYYNSYGSPFTYDISYAYDVLPSGTIEGFNSYSVVYDHSYGNFIL